jgi:hypothetical protein
LNFIFGIVCLFVCVCAFSLHRESPDMILGDKPLIFEVVLSQRRPEDAAPRVGTRAPDFGFIIGIRRILLRIGSLCRELHPNRQDRSGYPGRDIHPPALDRGIELIHIGIGLWSRFI